ncbi:MAG: alpha/beta hydrolase-fold protein [Acidobacteriota bacterium]
MRIGVGIDDVFVTAFILLCPDAESIFRFYNGNMVVEQIETHYSFGSGALVPKRNVSVYLPPDYHLKAEARFPVLYLQDGQNLFNPQTAYSGVAWQVDETAQQLILEKKIPSLIIVGIDNTGEQRIDEYTPVHSRGRGGNADFYGKMFIEELKPFIDHTYRTLPEREYTGLGGSSLGGLLSLYLGIKRHDVFSRLAVMSPSVWWANGFLLQEIAALPNRLPLRIWLDIGRREGRHHKTQARLLHDLLLRKGWRKHRNARLADFRYLEVPKAQHDESAWGARFHKVLRFLYPLIR